MHDMEGLSGQDDWHSYDFVFPEYAQGREFLIGDVNAVIDGLFAGGADRVDVVDGHGSGNPDPDLPADRLDPRARQILRGEQFDPYFDLPAEGGYDAVAFVGMHAKTGSRGFASHTWTTGIEIVVNGHSVTETELVGLVWGQFRIPVVFVSGDDRLGNDLFTMPWIEYVTVKNATSASTAALRPVEEARADLRASAQRAVDNLPSAQVMQAVEPVRIGVRAVPPASLARLEDVPGVDYRDRAVWFEAPNLLAARKGLESVIGIATSDFAKTALELAGDGAVGARWRREYWTILLTRWLDYESGRWSPATPRPDSGRMYHGAR